MVEPMSKGKIKDFSKVTEKQLKCLKPTDRAKVNAILAEKLKTRSKLITLEVKLAQDRQNWREIVTKDPIGACNYVVDTIIQAGRKATETKKRSDKTYRELFGGVITSPIEAYLSATENAYQRKDNAVYSALKNARLFEFPSNHPEFDYFDTFKDSDFIEYAKKIDIRFWERLPFDHVWVYFSEFEKTLLSGDPIKEILEHAAIQQGMLFSFDGYARMYSEVPQENLELTKFDWRMDVREIFMPHALKEFQIGILRACAEMDLFFTKAKRNILDVQEISKKRRKQFKKYRGAEVPKLFYRIPLVDSVHRQSDLCGDGNRAELAYRFDVTAHDRLLLKSFKLPVDENARSQLEKRGYRFSLGHRPHAELLFAVQRRWKRYGSLKPDRWYMYKLIDIPSCIKGPKDKPYVPGRRTLPQT